MGSISTAFNIATGALEADQAALNVIANNTANVNTSGYTLETPTWRENDAVSLNGISTGAGVSMTGPQSQRSRVLEQAMQQQTQAVNATSARLTALDQMQAMFSGAASAGTDTSAASGIGSDLSNLFGAFAALEGSPAESAARQQVLSAAEALASDLNGAATQLQSQRQSLNEEAGGVVAQANALLTNIAQLNVQIESTCPKEDAGTLEDQRQQDLTQLSQLIGIRTVTTENNGLTVTTAGGALLVSQGQVFAMTSGQSGGVTHFYDSTGSDITSDLASGGELGGMLTARDQDIPQAEGELDTLAYSIATAVNAQNAAGSDENGNAGAAIFGLPATATAANPAGSAAGISVTMTDPSEIAAAAAGAGTADNANAIALADLENQAVVSGRSATEFYSGFVTALGNVASEVSTENTAQQAALTQLQNQIGSLSGVDLNDEAAQLEALEQSYQAASKLFTTLAAVMTAALNLGVQTAYSS